MKLLSIRTGEERMVTFQIILYLYIGGDLDIRYTSITILPENLIVKGDVKIAKTPLIVEFSIDDLNTLYPSLIFNKS